MEVGNRSVVGNRGALSGQTREGYVRLGPHIEGVVAQGVFMGPCPASLGEQSARPMREELSYQAMGRVECQGRVEEKHTA